MSKVTYDNIEPNIAEVDVNGANVKVTWKCPVSGRIVGDSQADMKAAGGTTRAARTHVQRTLLAEAVTAFNRFIQSLFGTTAGKVAVAASGAVRTGVEQSMAKPVYTPAAEHEAVVAAFRQVEGKFRWDEDRELFVATSNS
jgi:hypothetical protein